MLPGFTAPREVPQPPPAPEWSRQKAQAHQALRDFRDRMAAIRAQLRNCVGAEWILDERAAGRLRWRAVNVAILFECFPDLFPRGVKETTRRAILELLAAVQYAYDRRCYLAATRQNLSELCGLPLSTLDWWMRRLRRFGVLQVDPVFRVNEDGAAWRHTRRPNVYYSDLFFNWAMRADKAPDWTPRRQAQPSTPAAGDASRRAAGAAAPASPPGARLGAISCRSLDQDLPKGRVPTATDQGESRRCGAAAAGVRGLSTSEPAPPTTPDQAPAKARAAGARSDGAVKQPRAAAGGASTPPEASKEWSSRRPLTDGRNRGAGWRKAVVDGKSFAGALAATLSVEERPRRSHATTVQGALAELRAIAERLGRPVAPAAAAVDAREVARRATWERQVRAVVLGNGGAWFDFGELPEDLRAELERAYAEGVLSNAAGLQLAARLAAGGPGPEGEGQP